jgi:diaminohydroxyphosphoribosylaminopyrimidine deaminase/5-amino-6-(5-phosphoribosylamino)uracil reductase
MLKAIQLAHKGWPAALPNPMVGCVIVHKDEIVASGYHQKFGSAHAEVNAVANLPNEIKPSDCTVYVTLEPCSHFGKTPPCADLLISKGFKKVVVACLDPNPLVAGKGIERLQAAGIEVEAGICEEEARALNVRFFTFHDLKRPYIILKWAQSADGYISRFPVPADRSQNMISRAEAQVYAHQLRTEVQAVMVGKNTALADNPALTVRLVEGVSPLRVLIDKQLELPTTAALYNGEAPSLIVNEKKTGQEGANDFFQVEAKADVISLVLTELHRRGIQSLLVEGGTQLLQSFLEAGMWDEVQVIKNPDLMLNSGVKAPSFNGIVGPEKLGLDEFFRHRNPNLGSMGLRL